MNFTKSCLFDYDHDEALTKPYYPSDVMHSDSKIYAKESYLEDYGGYYVNVTYDYSDRNPDMDLYLNDYLDKGYQKKVFSVGTENKMYPISQYVNFMPSSQYEYTIDGKTTSEDSVKIIKGVTQKVDITLHTSYVEYKKKTQKY